MVGDVDDSDLPWGVRLRRWREDVKLWSQQELTDRVVRLAFETKEERGTRLDVRLIGKWEAGEVGRPQSVYRRLLSGLGAPIPVSPGAAAQPLLPLDANVVVDHRDDRAPRRTPTTASTSTMRKSDTEIVVPNDSAAGVTVTHFGDHALDQLVQLFSILQRGDGRGDEDGEEAMERRAFIMQSSAVLAEFSMGGSVAALEAVRHELNRSVADEPRAAEVEEWQAIALDYGQTYLVTAPATLLATLLVDLRGVQHNATSLNDH